jgi:hypothetical protein
MACLAFCLWKGWQFVVYHIDDYKQVISECRNTINVGIKLTLSSVNSMLILGIGLFFIDSHWGIIVFGKVSFALSLVYFALAFIQQVSMVFFPILRRTNQKKKIYLSMYQFCFFVMPIIYLLIIPMKTFVEYWLPVYTDSIYYVSIMLPICIFDAKMNLIFNTFFKVLRKEKMLFAINSLVLLLSCILYSISTFIFNSYHLVIFSMVLVIVLRSILSERMANKLLNINLTKSLLYEISFATIYITSSLLVVYNAVVFVILLIFLIMELLLFRNEFLTFFKNSYQLITRNSNKITTQPLSVDL